jgi:RNA polymerase sigma factor (sigma-70 family)
MLRDAVGRPRGWPLDPEDAAQEAWLALIGLSPIGPTGDVVAESPARLVVAIRNRLVDLARRAGRRQFEALAREEAHALVGREEDPAGAYERNRIRAAVRAVVEEARDRVSEGSHRIVVLRWIEGRTFAEIAEGLGMPVARVRDRHRRAIPVLRALLIRRLGSDPTGLPAASLVAVPRGPEIGEVTP